MTKKELIELLANMPDDAQVMVFHNGCIYDICEIEHHIKLNNGSTDNLIKLKGGNK